MVVLQLRVKPEIHLAELPDEYVKGGHNRKISGSKRCLLPTDSGESLVKVVLSQWLRWLQEKKKWESDSSTFKFKLCPSVQFTYSGAKMSPAADSMTSVVSSSCTNRPRASSSPERHDSVSSGAVETRNTVSGVNSHIHYPKSQWMGTNSATNLEMPSEGAWECTRSVTVREKEKTQEVEKNLTHCPGFWASKHIRSETQTVQKYPTVASDFYCTFSETELCLKKKSVSSSTERCF